MGGARSGSLTTKVKKKGGCGVPQLVCPAAVLSGVFLFCLNLVTVCTPRERLVECISPSRRRAASALRCGRPRRPFGRFWVLAAFLVDLCWCVVHNEFNSTLNQTVFAKSYHKFSKIALKYARYITAPGWTPTMQSYIHFEV